MSLRVSDKRIVRSGLLSLGVAAALSVSTYYAFQYINRPPLSAPAVLGTSVYNQINSTPSITPSPTPTH